MKFFAIQWPTALFSGVWISGLEVLLPRRHAISASRTGLLLVLGVAEFLSLCAGCAKFLQSCLTLTLWRSPLSFSVHGILQARRLEWGAMPSSRRPSWSGDWTHALHWQMGSLPLAPHYFLTIYSLVTLILWSEVEVTQLCPTLCDPTDCTLWNSPGQNTGVGSLSLLQGIFPGQGSNPGLLPCRQILYQLS